MELRREHVDRIPYPRPKSMMKRPQSTRLGKRKKIDHLLKFDKTFLVDPSPLILPINQIDFQGNYYR